MNDWAIQAQNLGKFYLVDRTLRLTGLREAVSEMVPGIARRLRSGYPHRRVNSSEEFASQHRWALRHLSLEVRKGEALGILGANGAGKTTVLRILSRITRPSEGRFRVRGRLGALLDGGAALHGELTGRENILLYAALLGMTKAETRNKFDDMVAFAGLERSIDVPIKRYSTGMCLRLAFSVAAHFEPEILLVDDVLGGADLGFQNKCLEKMMAAARQGRTAILVSHQPEHVRQLCDRGIVLSGGLVVYSDSSGNAANFYESHISAAMGRGCHDLEEAVKEA